MVAISRDEVAAMRRETMGCWWPSRAYPKLVPDWQGIVGELKPANLSTWNGRRKRFEPISQRQGSPSSSLRWTMYWGEQAQGWLLLRRIVRFLLMLPMPRQLLVTVLSL